MYILKNALKNLVRNRGRNILVAAIIFIIVATTVVALIINNTASAVIADYSSRFGSQVTISPDMDRVREAAAHNGNGTLLMPEISPDLLLSFANSPALQKTEAYGSFHYYSDGASFKVVGSQNQNQGLVYGDYWKDFTDGTRALVHDGVSAFPSKLNECLISQDLARLNGIKVGDLITFTTTMWLDIPSNVNVSRLQNGDHFSLNGHEYTFHPTMTGAPDAYRFVEYTFKVTGIYYDLTDEYAGSSNTRNDLLTTLGTLLSARAPREDNVTLNVTYYLKNPGLLDEFTRYCRSKGLSDLFDVSADTTSYNTIVKPVQALQSMSITFLIIVLVLGAAILILLTTIAIRERKYEIGVLRAMGMKRRKVALGLWTELLVLTLACLLIGIGTGSAVAQPVTTVLIQQQAAAVSSQNSQQSQIPSIGKLGDTSNTAQPLSELRITVNFQTILEIIGIVLLLASLAGFVSIGRITRYEPIKILTERN